MTFLDTIIHQTETEAVRETYQDRLDIVRHKIKFMDRVPVAVLDTHNEANNFLDPLLEMAGGEVVTDPLNAKVILYVQPGVSMLSLMGAVPTLLDAAWPAVTFNRVYLIDDLHAYLNDAEYAFTCLEDLAEILNPGAFIFGNEGKNWMSFGV